MGGRIGTYDKMPSKPLFTPRSREPSANKSGAEVSGALYKGSEGGSYFQRLKSLRTHGENDFGVWGLGFWASGLRVLGFRGLGFKGLGV